MSSARALDEGQSAAASGRLVGDRYRVHEFIGRGRLGNIYSASDEAESRRDVALQILPSALGRNDAAITRLESGYAFLREAGHPDIVAYLDFGRDDRFRYVVMDLLEGASMRAIIDHAETLPPDEVAPVVRALGAALTFLHANGIAHGKITAANVFVTDALNVKLLEVVPLKAPRSGRRGLFADDVCALACLAYEMLKGAHPFEGRTRAEARKARILPARIDGLPEAQWNAICHALTFDEKRRTTTVEKFLREFGIDGTERLRPEQGRRAETADRQRGGPQRTASAGKGKTTTNSDTFKSSPATIIVDRDERRARRPRRLRPAILFAVLLILGAWFWFGQPREDVAVLADRLEASLGPASSPMTGNDVDAPRMEAVEPPVRVTAGETSPAGVQADAGDADTATGTGVVLPGISTVAADDAALASSGDADMGTAADATTPAPPVAFELAVVTVSEGDSAVRLALTATDPTATAYWWTRDHDAVAGEDYVGTGTRRLTLGEGEDSAAVLVPLVNDGVPEGIEDFFVHLGVEDADSGRLVPVDTVRIDIIDDD